MEEQLQVTLRPAQAADYPETEHLLRLAFPGIRFYHSHSMILEKLWLLQRQDTPKTLYACFDGNQAFLFCYKEQKLQYANTFPADKADNAAYFLLSVWKGLGLDAGEDTCVLAGRGEAKDETALRLGGNRLSTSAVSEIYSLGRSLLRIPATPLPGVKETLEKISRSRSYRTIVITKGNMLDQERKLECSGLKPFFDHVEIVSDKNVKTYSDLLAFLGIGASELLMVGNSFKSDISPVLRLGGYGVYIPFHTTWLHEQTDEYDHPNLFRADNFRELENIVL